MLYQLSYARVARILACRKRLRREQVESELRRQEPRDEPALDAVPRAVEARSEGAEPALAG